MKSSVKVLAATLLAVAGMANASAETSELRIAQQYGLSSLPLLVMQDSKLIEKHAKEAGLDDLKVSWVKLGGPGALTEAIISGDIDFANGGVPSLLALWDKKSGQLAKSLGQTVYTVEEFSGGSNEE